MMIPESHPSGSLPELARRQAEPARWREALHTTLLAWYREHGRALPWRETRDPYRIWLSEVMLQQTQVERVIPYYHRFLQRFPDLAALAAAHEDEVLKAWEGLGFYRRARLFHQAARELVGEGARCPPIPSASAASRGWGRIRPGRSSASPSACPCPPWTAMPSGS